VSEKRVIFQNNKKMFECGFLNIGLGEKIFFKNQPNAYEWYIEKSAKVFFGKIF